MYDIFFQSFDKHDKFHVLVFGVLVPDPWLVLFKTLRFHVQSFSQ